MRTAVPLQEPTRHMDGATRGSLSLHNPLIGLARQMLNARARCAPLFPKNVFRDSAWDMMLELFIAAEERTNVCVKELMVTSGESATGTMRRIDRLEEAGLVRRRPDPYDHRRVFVELTVNGRGAMMAMLQHLFHAARPEGSASADA